MGATAISAPPTDGGFQNQDERSAATRKKLMDGAYQILRRLGHAGLRSANIAEESGVSRGGLLHHYASKELLIAAVCERIFNEMEEESWQRISETSDENILSAIVKDARDRFFDESCIVLLDILVASRDEAPVADVRGKFADRDRSLARDAWANRLAATGVDRRTARLVTGFLWNAVKGMAIRTLVREDKEHEERAIALALQLSEQQCASARMT